ncbi:regulatory protein MsrR [Abditibacteriota bacterium]|nr:regulatory protein MsrR [Abditibacteriota bacterium]
MAAAQPRNANSNQPELLSPQPRKKGWFWKGVGLLTLCSVLTGAGFALFTKPGQETTAIIKEFAKPIIDSKRDPNLLFTSVGTVDGHVNVLLVGRDRNWKQGKVLDPRTGKMRPYQVEDTETRPRSDTMIIASFDRDTRAVRLISIPRDTRVKFDDLAGRRHGPCKLNSVYALPNGDKLLPKVIADELGVRIDRIAEIKLDGFTKLIDRVGGLDINVEGGLFSGKRKRMKYTDHWGGWSVDLMPGMQHLNGEQAHGYVRYRYDNEGDPGRVRRQQQVMRELAKQMMHVGITKLPGLVTELQALFNTDLSNEELVSAAMFAQELGSSKISPMTPYGTYQENGDIKLNRPENQKLFAAIFGSSFDPKKFLKLSPETTGDDIGARNNDNPAALPVLRDAGLLKAEKHHDAQLEAPGLQ